MRELICSCFITTDVYSPIHDHDTALRRRVPCAGAFMSAKNDAAATKILFKPREDMMAQASERGE